MLSLPFKLIFPLTLLSLCSIPNSQCKFKSRLYGQSLRDMKLLGHFDLKLAKDLTQAYFDSDKLPNGTFPHQVKIYLEDFYQSIGLENMEGILKLEEPVLGNSICALRLIHRVKYLLPYILSTISFRLKLGSLIWRNIWLFFWRNNWPQSKDLVFVADGILRLQNAYDFDVEEFAAGKLSPSYETKCTLTSVHSYGISAVAMERKLFASAIEWLELAKDKALTDNQASIPFIEYFLRKAIRKHNLELDEEIMLEMEPTLFNREITCTPKDSKNATKIRNIQMNAFKGKRGTAQHTINYFRLCSGENMQTEAEKSKLFCWYEFKVHQTFTIGPLKMEFLAKNPDIVQIYKVFHEKEIEEILAKSQSVLAPSKVGAGDIVKVNGKVQLETEVVHKSRTALNAWLYGKEANKLSRKVELITGLQAVNYFSAEPLQIASYSYGGHYTLHLDASTTDLDGYWARAGQRLATFMIYLNDVEEGGRTVFADIGISVKPRKGSAVFWYNVYSSGIEDTMLNHGACPLLAGEKLAANKWIHFHDQMSLRKCGLTPRERFQIPVNGGI